MLTAGFDLENDHSIRLEAQAEAPIRAATGRGRLCERMIGLECFFEMHVVHGKRGDGLVTDRRGRLDVPGLTQRGESASA